MMNENPILGNQLVVMSRADLDALVEKMASSMAATRVEVEDKSAHRNGVCPVMYENERFITREETSKLLHVDYSTLWRWNKLGLVSAHRLCQYGIAKSPCLDSQHRIIKENPHMGTFA